MRESKILSWNVNGVRAVAGKGFMEWLQEESPDILCLQETKAQPQQLGGALLSPEGYHAYWNYPEKKGYSGVAVFSRREPRRVSFGFGMPEFDQEGRTIAAEYEGFVLLNIYFPNGKKDESRLNYKMAFYEAFLRFADSLRAGGKELVVCGDFNTAHKEIDLARPRENATVSGFLPQERAWLDRFTAAGYIDTFRHFNKEPGQYTWWDYKSGARARNVGWRIDYFFVTRGLLPSVAQAFIMPGVMGSDHCPIGILLQTD